MRRFAQVSLAVLLATAAVPLYAQEEEVQGLQEVPVNGQVVIPMQDNGVVIINEQPQIIEGEPGAAPEGQPGAPAVNGQPPLLDQDGRPMIQPEPQPLPLDPDMGEEQPLPSDAPLPPQQIPPVDVPRALTPPTTIPMTPFNPDARVMFNFKDASVETVLDYLSESMGFIIIKDARIDARVTIASRQAVSGHEAVDLLNSVLRPLNYTAIQTGRALRIVTLERARRSNIAVHFGADPEQIRQSDEIITQVIPLGQVDAVRLRQDLANLFSTDADVTANQGSNTIIITDSSANIRRIAQIISAMDRHMSSTSDIKIFQLEFANATSAARLVNELFQAQGTTGGRTQQQQTGQRFPGQQFGRGFPGMPGAAGQPGQQGDATRALGRVTASADDRTNTLVVVGPAEVLPVVERVVKELDSNPAETSTVFVYSLRNAQSANLQGVLSALFGTSTGAVRTGGTQGTQSLQRQPFGNTTTSGIGGRTGTTGTRTGTTGVGTSGRTTTGTFGTTGRTGTTGTGITGRTGTFGGTGGTAALSTAARAAAGELAGQVWVVADPDTNALIITTAPKLVESVKAIVAELDRSVPQVLIKVLIAEVTHENGSDLGFEFSVLNRRANGLGVGGGTDFGLAQETGGMIISMAEQHFEATLRALATTGKVDVLSRPYILASDNQLASILVGQQVPFVTNTRITDTGQVINTVEYQDVGIILNVTPHINPDGKVIMDVAPEISSLLRDTTVRISDTVSAPVFSKRSAQSRVAIENGRTIVIGGLMEDKKSVLVRKVPLLGDLPLLGNAFRRTQENKSKTELLIFLTPHVAVEATDLEAMSQDEMRGVKITPQAVSPGTFQDHMDGMNRGATTRPVDPIFVPPAMPTEDSVSP